MPGESFTVELWARGAPIAGNEQQQQRSTNLFSYATESMGPDGACGAGGGRGWWMMGFVAGGRWAMWRVRGAWGGWCWAV